MKEIKNKIRNFRVTTELDSRLLAAAARIEMDPSKLMRIMVEFGTSLMLCGMSNHHDAASLPEGHS